MNQQNINTASVIEAVSSSDGKMEGPKTEY